MTSATRPRAKRPNEDQPKTIGIGEDMYDLPILMKTMDLSPQASIEAPPAKPARKAKNRKPLLLIVRKPAR